ncbi:MAG: GNAT family N-acetyltransferase [Planctomycetota bacterium]|nr:MAG: GNAT family N-acetyltransferase [Planctomycetota bacterium]
MKLNLINISTSRLRLCAFKPSDDSAIQNLAGDIKVYQTTLNLPHPYELEMATKWISSHAIQFEKGNGVTLAIQLKPKETIVGTITLGISQRHNKAELGFWVGVPYWNQGICTEASNAMINFAFDDLKLNKVTSRHLEGNHASGRVMQKCGMVQEGILKNEILKDEAFHDLVVYGILKN